MSLYRGDDQDRADYMVRIFGGPRLSGELAGRSLSPQQSAFLAIVYAHRRISRPQVSRILWRRDADRRSRASIRQLRHQVTRRAGIELVGAEGDDLVITVGIEDDLGAWREHLDGGRFLEAARLLREGFASRPLPGVHLEFLDWKDRVATAFRSELESAARVAWASARETEKWNTAREAAEALYLLQDREERDYQQVIEARAKSGRLLAAEVAYADYVQHLDGKAADEGIESLMNRVRALAKNQERSLAAAEVPFVGREDEMTRLQGAVERVKDGEFTVAIVSGESGIGKTRLMAEVRRMAQLDGVRCLTAQPVELEKPISLNPILDAISDVDLEPHLTRMGEPWRTVVGAMLPSSSPSATRVPPPPIDETALSRRLLDAFSLLLHSLAEEEPTILFIDDLQWVDATTMAVLEFYGRRWSSSRLGIMAAVRSDMLDPRDPVRSFTGTPASPGRTSLELTELSESDGRRLLELASDGSITEGETLDLFSRVGTHPQYLLELWKERHNVPLTGWRGDAVPISLRQIAANRLGTLSLGAKGLARLLAVVGKPIGVSTISAILGEDDATLSAAITELRVRRLATYDAHRLHLSHDLFRSVLYLDLQPHTRESLHVSYAEQLIAEGTTALGELAIHLDRGGRTRDAAHWASEAGESAFAQGAMVEAAEFFELAGRGAEDDTVRARATAKQGTALFLARNLRPAVSALGLAVQRLNNCGLAREARALGVRAIEAVASLGDSSPADLVERLSVIKVSAKDDEDWESLALALDAELRVVQYIETGNAANRVFSEMEELSNVGNTSAATVCRMGLAMESLFGVSVDPDRAMRAARAAVELSADARQHRLHALQRCLVVLQLRGRIYSAETHALLTEARELSRTQGDRRARYSIESNFATGLLDAGDIDRAEHLLEEAEQFLGSGDMDLARFHHWCNLAEIALVRTDYSTAQSSFENAQEYSGQSTPPYARAVVNAGLGICALKSGDLAAARRYEAALGSHNTPYLIDPTTELTFRCLLLERRQLREQALGLLAEACQRYYGRAETVWLKLVKMRIERMLRWGHTSPIEGLLADALSVAHQCGLPVREAELEELRSRAAATNPG